MKPEFENLPDIGEAWIAAVEFNGPVDPLLIKLKHESNVKEAKEKREEADPSGRLGLARGDHDSDRKDREDRTRTLTWLLANNPAYAELHAEALQSWRDTEDAAEKALRQIEAALEQARTAHEKRLERASLIDGKRVFRDEDGSVWTEDDIRLPDEVAAGIQWKGDEPTRKEFKAGQARIDELIRSGDRIRGIQVEVADLGAELNDNENPPSSERTEEIKDTLEDYRQEVHDERRRLGLVEDVGMTAEPSLPVATNIPKL